MENNLIQESFHRLFPQAEFSYQTKLEYNRRLGPFNANITLRRNLIQINFNLNWKDIDHEIKIGLVQHLLLRILKKRGTSSNINLYNNFVKNIPQLTIKTKTDPVLEESFSRVNCSFFYEQLELPNLQWGQKSFRKLASYNFHNDTITVSTLFQGSRSEVLDYLMYHELLHKHHKFKHDNGRSSFHTKEFREDEKLYPHHELIEKEIESLIRTRKRKERKSLWDFF